MRVKLLLGSAGSGKTFRCLEEIRAALKKNPGEPLAAPKQREGGLIFLAPKQATFQIERQLLAEDSLRGFSRLQILSFDRLAQFVLEQFHDAPAAPKHREGGLPKILSGEGRVMILRALLLKHEKELKLFSRSARRPGFAQELSSLLAELRQHQFSPKKLNTLSGNKKLRGELQNKLHDLALLSEHYSQGLAKNGLQDADAILDFATDALRSEFKTQNSKLKIETLWLDGFAEMTPQELDLLAAVIPFCQNATLAFCLENHAAENARLSIWSAIGKTFQQCRARIENLPGAKIEIQVLERDPQKNRFSEKSELFALEKNWANQNPKVQTQNSEDTLQIVACPNPETEAVFAAREILKFVRDGKNRFRDCAVLVRNLENYHQPLARIFRRYEIPFFLDRRESVAHHPLAELTRSALRTVAFDWPNDDWFAALKAGFCPADETEIDRLENAALEFGWRGKKWREPLRIEKNPALENDLEQLRQKILPPFENLAARFSKIKFQPNGGELAEIIRELWDDLRVEKILENWNSAALENISPHSTVWEQMNSWLDNLALAFPAESLPLRDWLPILEAGLASLTVGVVPPTLDQVLVGAIDRARNPNLKFALVLGVNESVFPAPPHSPTILTNADRDELESENAAFGPNVLDQISRERYLGYIAGTRASEKLTLTFARQNADGKTQNASPFVAQLQKIFPQLEIKNFSSANDWHDAQSAVELIPPLVETQNAGPENPDWKKFCELPALKNLAEKIRRLREPDKKENLSPALAEKIYGPVLKSSVSRLEEFAACPFKFFIHSGLRANERKIFELDARERGSFQHEVLKTFHEHLVLENKRWRDISSAEARERIAHIAAELTPNFQNGILNVDAQSRFNARALTAALQDFVGTLVAWMHGQYEFDPVKAELEFGLEKSHAPAWEIDLGDGHKLALRGKIDRIDLHQDGERTLAVVLDYKSSQKKLDKILVEHGVQLQLLGYLAAMRNWPPEILGAGKIFPAGTFYINLRGQFESGGSREEILSGADEARRRAYRHAGRFDAGFLKKLDRGEKKDQFNYRLTKNGEVYANSTEALTRADFQSLLDGVEIQLREFGREIFAGAAQVDPYRKGKQTPCEFCDYQAACRIDKQTHEWRVLRPKTVDEVD